MKLLCATDLLPKSDPAVDRAFELKKSLGAKLALLHVVPPIGAEEGTLEQRLLSARSRLGLRSRHAGGDARLLVRCGRPTNVVCEEARAADLAIIGPHRADVLVDTVRGTFAERLLGEARCPVLVARRSGGAPYRTLLLALDGSHATGDVIRMAESLPLGEGSELAVLHAHEPPYEAMMNTVGVGNLSVARYASASMSQAAAMIHAELQRHSRDPRRYRVLLVDARPGPGIRQALREVRPDLLVLGTRGHGRLRRALLGSTAHEALRAADCDVLVVPESATPEGPAAAA